MDFDENGKLLVTSSDDETLRLYYTDSATSGKVLFSKKYGIDLVRFTHSPDAVICASKNNWDGSSSCRLSFFLSFFVLRMSLSTMCALYGMEQRL